MEGTCFSYSNSDTEVDNERVWTANIHSISADEKEVDSHDDEQNGSIFVLTYDHTLGTEPWRYCYPIIELTPISEYKKQKSKLILDVLCETKSDWKVFSTPYWA